jgi:hypothetical protein
MEWERPAPVAAKGHMSMTFLLASAEQTDLSGSGWFVILMGLAVLAAAAALTVIPIAAARGRLHPRAEAITVAAIFWGFLAAASAIRFGLAKLQWSKDFTLMVKTGYYDPANTSAAPPWPWLQWGLLAAAYCVLVAVARSHKRIGPP